MLEDAWASPVANGEPAQAAGSRNAPPNDSAPPFKLATAIDVAPSRRSTAKADPTASSRRSGRAPLLVNVSHPGSGGLKDSDWSLLLASPLVWRNLAFTTHVIRQMLLEILVTTLPRAINRQKRLSPARPSSCMSRWPVGLPLTCSLQQGGTGQPANGCLIQEDADHVRLPLLFVSRRSSRSVLLRRPEPAGRGSCRKRIHGLLVMERDAGWAGSGRPEPLLALGHQAGGLSPSAARFCCRNAWWHAAATMKTAGAPYDLERIDGQDLGACTLTPFMSISNRDLY